MNGEQIGRPEYWPLPDEPAVGPLTEHELKDGDEFKVGGTVFKVQVFERLEEVPELEVRVEPGMELCACE